MKNLLQALTPFLLVFGSPLLPPAVANPYGSAEGGTAITTRLETALKPNAPVAVTISGRVTDEKGEGIPGVSVVLKGTTTGTSTDISGNYSLSLPDATGTLTFSYIGYLPQEVPINNQTVINVTLAPDVKQLSEVVVIGYGTQERTDLTGSVASVSPTDLRRAPVATVNEAIQGRVPGVTVTSSGAPGQASNINIRGIGSLNGGSNPLYVIDGVWTDNLRDFNPADVESIQILKDAATTAIYGSRGANGVVIITTKRGRSGATAVTFNGYAGVQNIPKRWDLTNAREFADINNLAHDNAGVPRMPGASTQFNPNVDTDWQDAMYQQGSIQEYNLSLSGGGENSNVLVSGGYYNQRGTLLNTQFERYSLRVNSGFTKGRFRFGENAMMVRSNTINVNGSPFIDMVRMLPTIPIYDPTKSGGFGFGDPVNTTYGTNPVALQELQRSPTLINRLLAGVYGEYSFSNALTYRLNLGLEYQDVNDRTERKYGQWRQGDPLDPAFLRENRSNSLFLLIENTLTFQKTFGLHNVSAVGGYTEQRQRSEFIQGVSRGYGTGPLYYFELSAGAGNPEIYGQSSQWSKRSYLGRILYDYDDRYLLTASVRWDGSSRFDPENRWGTFGAVSLGWRISKEKFFENVPVISNLKLRASYGVNGNDNLGTGNGQYTVANLGQVYGQNYLYQSTVNQTINYILGPSQSILAGAIQTQLPSTGIKWESRYTTNVGIDVGVLEDRVQLSADYYVSTTRNALVNPLLPYFLGNYGGEPFVNLGRLENRGFELALTYQENRNPFKYTITGNLTTIKNTVKELATEGQVITGGPEGGITRTQVGQPVGAFYLIQTDGIFQSAPDANGPQAGLSAGDVRYVDANNDGVINNQDRTFVGSPFPKLQYGLNMTASYRNFDLTLFFQGVAGNDVWNGVRFWLDRMDENGNYRRDLNPWTGPGTSNSTPRPVLTGPSANNNRLAASTRWLESGSYLRLKNVQLGYTFPSDLVKRLKWLSSLRVYVTGQNVFTVTKYTGLDPETVGSGFFGRGIDEGSFPNLRTFTGGLQIGF